VGEAAVVEVGDVVVVVVGVIVVGGVMVVGSGAMMRFEAVRASIVGFDFR